MEGGWSAPAWIVSPVESSSGHSASVTDGFEAVDLRLDGVDLRLDALTTALTEFKKTADAHHAAVLSALMALGRSR